MIITSGTRVCAMSYSTESAPLVLRVSLHVCKIGGLNVDVLCWIRNGKNFQFLLRFRTRVMFRLCVAVESTTRTLFQTVQKQNKPLNAKSIKKLSKSINSTTLELSIPINCLSIAYQSTQKTIKIYQCYHIVAINH